MTAAEILVSDTQENSEGFFPFPQVLLARAPLLMIAVMLEA